jgi:signal transduction histidine kinase
VQATSLRRPPIEVPDAPPVKTTDPLDDLCEATRGNVAAWLNLSHELRTPTHAILGHVELLLSGAVGPISSEMRASLGDIQKAAVAIAARIGDVVEFAERLPSIEPASTATRLAAASKDHST